MSTQPEIRIGKSPAAIAAAAARLFAALTRQATQLTVPGGTLRRLTPKILYQLLVSDEFRGEVPWDAVDFFFGDERWVPHD